MADEDGFGSRARRFARTTRAVGGLAAKVAGERYLGVNINRDKHAGDLRAALGGRFDQMAMLGMRSGVGRPISSSER